MQTKPEASDERLTWGQRWASRIFLFISRFSRGMTLGARAVILKEDQVFLIRHSYMPGLQLPGGGVEAGETLFTALEREVDEEAGLRIVGAAEWLGFYQNTSVSRRDHVAVFIVRNHEPIRATVPNREIAEAGWYDLTALPADVTPGTLRRIKEALGQSAVSRTW